MIRLHTSHITEQRHTHIHTPFPTCNEILSSHSRPQRLTVGLTLATVTDTELALLGFAFGLLAITLTVGFQTNMEQTQKRSSISGAAMQIHIAPWQCLTAFLFAVAIEIVPNLPLLRERVFATITTGPVSLESVFATIRNATDPQLLLWFCGSCAAAQAVNFYCYTIIGRFSAVTYQVIAHLKTVLVLSYALTLAAVWDPVHLTGLGITFCGIVWYSNAKGREGAARGAVAEKAKKIS